MSEEAREERGVQNPKVIDLIALDGKTDQVIVSMVEDRPWGHSEEQLDQLQEKFNNYVDYVLDGWLYSQYPQYVGKKVVIEIQGIHEPDAQQNRFFEAMQRFCQENNLGFHVTVSESVSRV
jgi:hypothetical protein